MKPGRACSSFGVYIVREVWYDSLMNDDIAKRRQAMVKATRVKRAQRARVKAWGARPRTDCKECFQTYGHATWCKKPE